MITIRTNLTEVMTRQLDKLKSLQSVEGQQNVMRIVALSMLPVVHDRIHVEGLDANGSPIGTYSKGYLKYTRPKYNRGQDPKVILSLTRQMESDFSVVATEKGYGIGFKNPLNFQKANWVEETYHKKIYGLTPDEKDKVLEVVNEEVHKLFSDNV